MEEISCVSLAVTLQTRTVLGPGQDQSHHHHVVDDEVDSDGGLIPSHYIYIYGTSTYLPTYLHVASVILGAAKPSLRLCSRDGKGFLG